MVTRDSERLRLAIALIALRHKPADQTCASYVLELRQRYPLRPSSASHTSDSSGPWHTRALELEKDLRALQTKYDAAQVDLAAAQVTPLSSIGDPGATPACPAPTPVPEKKKSKKKKAQATPGDAPVDASADRPRADGVRGPWTNLVGLDLSSPHQLLPSMEVLDALLDARRRRPSAVSVDACALAAARVLDAIAATLGALLPPTTPSASASGVIQSLSVLTTRFLLATVPALSAPRKKTDDKAHLDALLGTLVTSILVPLLESFHALSRAHLTALFPPRPRKRKRSSAPQPTHDVRPDALAFLRTTLLTLAGLDVPAAGAHEACALAAVRAIQALYAPTDTDEKPQEDKAKSPAKPQDERPQEDKAKSTADDRIAQLARKDALWYLCATLHASLPSCASSPSSSALRESVCTALAGLLRRAEPSRVQRRSLLGPGEREMLLAVAEKVWLSQG